MKTKVINKNKLLVAEKSRCLLNTWSKIRCRRNTAPNFRILIMKIYKRTQSNEILVVNSLTIEYQQNEVAEKQS